MWFIYEMFYFLHSWNIHSWNSFDNIEFQVNGSLNLPTNVLIATIRKYRDQLNERYERIKNSAHESTQQLSQQTAAISPKPSGSGINVIKPRPTKIIPLKPYKERINFEKVIVSLSFTPSA